MQKGICVGLRGIVRDCDAEISNLSWMVQRFLILILGEWTSYVHPSNLHLCLHQVSTDMGLSNVGLVFQELLAQLQGAEDHSLVSGLVDLSRVNDSQACQFRHEFPLQRSDQSLRCIWAGRVVMVESPLCTSVVF